MSGADGERPQRPKVPGPFVTYADPTAGRQTAGLEGLVRLTVGRDDQADLPLTFDGSVSRLHAVLEWLGSTWTLNDDGLSRNGTFLNGERVSGRRRLRDGDRVVVGATVLTFHNPAERRGDLTRAADGLPSVSRLSEGQRAVLVALCRPYRNGASYATPATNSDIASELFLSVDAVKTHLRALFGRFGVEDLPQNQKRAKLAERALSTGVISDRDL